MANEAQILKMVAEMFARYPAAAKNATENQMRVYVDALSSWPPSCIERAIEAAAADGRRNLEFAPSLDLLLSKLKSIGMSEAELRERFALTGKPVPIAHQARAERGEHSRARGEMRFERMKREKREDMAAKGMVMLKEGVTLEMFQRRCRGPVGTAPKWPEGATFVAILATVFVPAAAVNSSSSDSEAA